MAVILDNLVSLAEYLGVLDLESPEQGSRWAQNLHVDPLALIERIGGEIGISVDYPAVMNSTFGIKTAKGVLSRRDITGLYAALRIKAISSNLGIDLPSVCEIGGGLGGTAYYAHLLGAQQYTIIDLPLLGALQAYFLLRILPNTSIQLYGEAESSPVMVRLFPTFVFEHPDCRWDILFNQDSIPEMHKEYSLNYLRQAKKNTARAFFSINQEARAVQHGEAHQTVVRDLVREVGGYRQLYRFRHWLRAGYAEELFEFGATRPAGEGEPPGAIPD